MCKKLLIALVATLFVVGLSVPSFAKPDKNGIDKRNKLIYIAGYDACTGKYGDYGAGDKRGQEIAVEEVNANGGILAGPLKGYKLKLDFYDDRGDPKESANIAKKISAGKFLTATGPTLSSCALAATPVFARFGVANIITYSNANSITEQGFDNLIRLTHTTKHISYNMADVIKNQFKGKKVATITENQDYGQQMLSAFKKKAKELGLEIVSEAMVTAGQDVDFKSILMKARLKKPDVLIPFTTYNEAGLIVRQARKMGWNDVIIYGTDALTEPKFFELAGNLDKVYLLLVPSLDTNRSEAKYLVTNYKERYGNIPPLAAIYGYDAIYVTKAIIERGGITRASFIKNMKKVKVPGLASPLYEFGPKGEGKKPIFNTMKASKFKADNM